MHCCRPFAGELLYSVEAGRSVAAKWPLGICKYALTGAEFVSI